MTLRRMKPKNVNKTDKMDEEESYYEGPIALKD